MDPMRPNDRRYSVRRIVTGCALCCLSTGTLSAMVLLVLFRVRLGDCNITCDERTEGAEQFDTGEYVCDGHRGCAAGERLAYYICLWVVIAIVGIWFFVGIAWMAVMWVYPSESSLPDALHTLDDSEPDVADSGHLAEV